MKFSLLWVLLVLATPQLVGGEDLPEGGESDSVSFSAAQRAYLENPLDDALRQAVLQEKRLDAARRQQAWASLSHAIVIYMRAGLEQALPWFRQSCSFPDMRLFFEKYYNFSDSERQQFESFRAASFYCPDCGSTQHQPCKNCQGLGSRLCPSCQGKGKGIAGPGYEQEKPKLCPRCQGWGTLPCTSCQGKGFYRCERCGPQANGHIKIRGDLETQQASMLLSLHQLLLYLLSGGVDYYSPGANCPSPLRRCPGMY